MIAVSVGLRRVATAGALAVALGSPVAAAAQDRGGQRQTWTLHDLHSGLCVQFLVDSVAARKQLDDEPAGHAGDAPRLHPVLANVLSRQPDLASWTPSSLCFFFAPRVSVPGKEVAERRHDRMPMVGVWLMDVGREGERRGLRLVTNSWQIERPAESRLVDVEQVEAELGPDSAGPGSHFEIKLGKTRLIWDGRAIVDTAAAQSDSLALAWGARGLRGTRWTASAAVRPAEVLGMVGSLRVEGNDDLAKALKASPIRFVGPLYRGGTVELDFTRQ